MEALLAGAARNNPGGLGSVAELADRLRSHLAEKVKPTRVEHASTTFALRSGIVFQIPVTDPTEAETIDPLLGGVPTAVVQDGLATRTVSVNDTIMDQPQDDPVLQKLVTKHLVATVGEVDGSDWIVRAVSRGAQGWTFTYICKDSCQAWSHQASKNPAKLVIGAWSNKDGQDPINMARPAFDCRGSVDISFNRGSRSINVKYEHSPIHKSVAQLMELVVPPPELVQPVVASKVKEPKAPRPPKTPKELKTPGSGRKKRPANGQETKLDGSGARSNKQRKKLTAQVAPEADMAPVEMMGALPVDGGLEAQQHSPQENGASQDGTNSYPSVDPTVGVHLQSLPHLPPGEAERRREVAIRLLTEANIDSQTLSVDQFGIFANQSPDLQQDSLVMLVKYGAERLRIVHPDKEPLSSPVPSQPESTNATPVTPNTESPNWNTGKSGRGEAVGAFPNLATPTAASRGGACQACRDKRSKCDKEKPSCTKCRASGLMCYYPPPKKRTRKTRETEPEAELQPVVEQTMLDQPVPEPPIDIVDDEPDDLPSPGFHPHESPDISQPSSVYPPPEPVSTFNQQPSGVYQSPSGLTFPRAVAPVPEMAQPLEFHQGPPEQPTNEYSYTAPGQPSTASFSQHNSTPAHNKAQSSSQHARSRSGVSLPLSQLSSTTSASINMPTQANTWLPHMQPQAAREFPGANTPSQGSSKNTGARKAVAPATTYNSQHQTIDIMQQANSSSQAVLNQSPMTTENNNYQGAAAVSNGNRAKARQGQRAQNRTPVQDMAASRRTEQASQSVMSSGDSRSGYNAYSQSQHPSTSREESTDDRIPYEPYSAINSASSGARSYSQYGNTHTNESNNASTNSVPVSQTMASSYSPSTAQKALQWGGTPKGQSQAQDAHSRAHAYVQRTSTPKNSSLNMPNMSAQRQPAGQQLPDVRQQLKRSHARNSSSSYGQQAQQSPYQQQQQQSSGPQSHLQREASTTQQQQQHQQSLYGLGSSNNASSGYEARSNTTASVYGSQGSHATGSSYNQQHRSMNLNGHAYSTIDGDQVLYDMLRNNQDP